MFKPNLAHLWKQTIVLAQEELSQPSLDAWLKSIYPTSFQDDTITLSVPNIFAKDWIENRYIGLLQEKIEFLLGRKVYLRLTTSNATDIEWTPPRLEELPISTLNPKYVFDTFVVGNSNRFAHAAALAVSEVPAKAYNPLFIYGGVGLGKTHLMHAIGHYILAQSTGLKVVYVTSETFTNDLINAIKDDKTPEFRMTYRNADVLLIDDIQFLKEKERTQEEFFHTFNALHQADKQVVISSDRPPKDLSTLEDRLRSRFEWGLITDIQPPDLETRIAILRKKAQLENLQLPDEVNVYIAHLIQANIRELEGALTRVVAYAAVHGLPITEELATQCLKDIVSPVRPKPITVPLIIETVANYYNLRIDDLTSKKRTRELSFPRQIAMYLARELTSQSLPQIGEAFGGRDHTTIMHGYDKISQQIKNDVNLKTIINELTSMLRSS
ncbi:MAG: chromosomal replication initiator protein DnaA [Bacillota bacterium]|jgi:chromosomal replication initiator protein